VGKYKNSYMKVYRYLGVDEVYSEKQEAEFLVKFEVLIEDKPGLLADFSSLIAEREETLVFSFREEQS